MTFTVPSKRVNSSDELRLKHEGALSNRAACNVPNTNSEFI